MYAINKAKAFIFSKKVSDWGYWVSAGLIIYFGVVYPPLLFGAWSALVLLAFGILGYAFPILILFLIWKGLNTPSEKDKPCDMTSRQ